MHGYLRIVLVVQWTGCRKFMFLNTFYLITLYPIECQTWHSFSAQLETLNQKVITSHVYR